jgi:hypothetical protein
MDNRVPVPPDASAAFTEVAQGARLMGHMFRSWGDPAPGSNFVQVNDLYPFEKVSDRAHHYVSAALEHLTMWADYAAPLKFHPDAVTVFTMRPAYALARAALESAAQAVWLMDTPDPVECVKRHLRLIRWDLQEHRKSKLDADGKQRVRDRDAQLLDRVRQVFTEDEIPPPPSYLWVIQQACRPEDLQLMGEEVERLWRAASGAAHGMYWTNLELTQVEAGEEYEPGHFRAFTLPDANAMVEALRAAHTMTQYAALKYLDYAGADIGALFGPARTWLAENMTLRPEADEETRRKLIELEPGDL